MSKLNCFICGEDEHFAKDFLRALDNTNIAQESEQNNKVENTLDLDNTSVCEECVMMCTELQYDDADKELPYFLDSCTHCIPAPTHFILVYLCVLCAYPQ